MEATGKYDYEASGDDELSFRRGELLVVIQKAGNWYKAEHKGREGFVPKNFITLHLPSWFHEDFGRRDAQEKLMQHPEGRFLLRGSLNTTRGDFSISVRHAADVQHFKVLQDSRGQYSIWSEKFPSLNQLVEHYKHNSLYEQSRMLLQEAPQQQDPNHGRPLPALPAPPAPPSPSPPPPLSSVFQQVRALYSFDAEETDELAFEVGDVVTVLECLDRVWWRGRLGDRTGLFPSNYTRPV